MFCQGKGFEYHFENIINACFDNLDLKTILKQYRHRFNVIDLFNRENYIPNITYLSKYKF